MRSTAASCRCSPSAPTGGRPARTSPAWWSPRPPMAPGPRPAPGWSASPTGAAGAIVTAHVSGPSRVEQVRALGADAVITQIGEDSGPFHLVVDGVGAPTP